MRAAKRFVKKRPQVANDLKIALELLGYSLKRDTLVWVLSNENG